MDPKHTGEVLKHLEKESEIMMDAYRNMSHELHKLQVEEEMLMRKFYEVMSAQGSSKKNKDGENIANGSEKEEDQALVRHQ
ncbi:hypothetical protein LIER_17229 [Lithospermum erythrorhizon]|uniref:Uncharacterized protein n=1 Tax=Lithospermum erythrorhizon TaxID=34254 RepID=A0AAV3Q9I5_LITER